MQHLAAEAAVARHRSAKAEDLGRAARIRVPEDRAVRAGPAVRRRGRKAQAVLVVQAVRAVQVTSGAPVVRVAPVDPATTAVPVGQAVPVGPVAQAVQVTSVDPAVPATTVDLAAPATSAVQGTTADPAVQETGDPGRAMPSAASTVSRGATEQRRGAGGHPRVPDGVDRSLPRAECGTKGRSTTGASKRTRFGIGTKTVGASGSSESGSRCKQPAR